MKPKLFYIVSNAKCGDIIPKYVDGKYQLFYLKHWLNKDAPDFVPGWHRMESDDLVHMGPETPIHVRGDAGDHSLPQRAVAPVRLYFPRG